RLVLLVERDPEWERHAVAGIVETVNALLAEEGLTLADIQFVLPPQRSARFVAAVAEALGVPAAVCVDVSSDQGDYFTSSLVHAMRHAQTQGLAQPGALGLVIEVGSGLNVGCALYRF